MYFVEFIEKEMTIKELLSFYEVNKLNCDCKTCPNYNRIWTCPPHDFNTYAYLNHYSTVQLYIAKINLDVSKVKKEDVADIFNRERRVFSDRLIALETSTSEALIAGNCYQCEICQRSLEKPCILEDKKRYSLEALGIKVGMLSKHAGVELKWLKGEISPYLVTVGAILSN